MNTNNEQKTISKTKSSTDQTNSKPVSQNNQVSDAKAAAIAAITKTIGKPNKIHPTTKTKKGLHSSSGSSKPERKSSANNKPKQEFEEKLVAWKRVSKTTKGGRQGRIWTLVVVGNRKGSIGYGIGKSEEFPDAMKKAVKNALKNVVKFKINANGTVYHENIGKHCASLVLIKPAKIGIGIIAGGPIKMVLELAGFTDIYSKNLGSSSAMNMVQATIKALLKQHTPAEIAKLRDKAITDL
ncbi:SSU ribosomal protein S5p (S2e) [[Mycoplasma] cavipharyngis]|uniref:30S ribosomal protein S5 n=1 Tax=[Mycoplasma] cavipharyngis TaxID=92757 RepID=UPI00370420F7